MSLATEAEIAPTQSVVVEMEMKHKQHRNTIS